MGSRNDQPLDSAAIDRFGRVIRAMSWVESKHGTAGANQPARDPMQCGNPDDTWWRELVGQTERQDRFTRGPGLRDLRAGELPAAADADADFPAAARISGLRSPARGHRAADFRPDHSFFWAIPYFLHRTNIRPSGRTYRCGSASLERLVDGAVAYNGGGDPRYRAKIEDALALIGADADMERVEAGPLMQPHVATSVGLALDAVAARAPALLRDILTELSGTAAPGGAADRPSFPARGIRVTLSVTTPAAEVVTADIRIDGAPTAPAAGEPRSVPDDDEPDEAEERAGSREEGEGSGRPCGRRHRLGSRAAPPGSPAFRAAARPPI